MASVTLRDLWIHNALNLADYIRLTMTAAPRKGVPAGTTLEFLANGERQAFRTEGYARDVTYNVYCTETEARYLNDWAAFQPLVLARDATSTKVWGHLGPPSETPEQGNDRLYVTVQFTVSQVANSETV